MRVKSLYDCVLLVRSVVVLIVLLSLTKSLTAQKMSLDFVRSWVIQCDSALVDRIAKSQLVIDGLPKQEKEVDSKLSHYDYTKDMVEINYLDASPLKGNMILNEETLIITVSKNNSAQDTQYQKGKIEAALQFYAQPTQETAYGQLFEKTPVVVINDEIMIDRAGTHSFLKKLAPTDIRRIVVMSKGPLIRYGEDAKNGLIKIWLN